MCILYILAIIISGLVISACLVAVGFVFFWYTTQGIGFTCEPSKKVTFREASPFSTLTPEPGNATYTEVYWDRQNTESVPSTEPTMCGDTPRTINSEHFTPGEKLPEVTTTEPETKPPSVLLETAL